MRIPHRASRIRFAGRSPSGEPARAPRKPPTIAEPVRSHERHRGAPGRRAGWIVATALAALAAACCAGLLAGAGPAAAGKAKGGKVLFGMNEDWIAHRWAVHPVEELGAGAIRFPLPWREIRPNRRTWDWTKLDQLAEQAELHGAKLVLMPQDAPCWVRPSLRCNSAGGHPPDPRYIGEYRKLLLRALKRYAPNVAAVEAWNEPNLTNFFRPKPKPKHYIKLLRATHKAVHSKQWRTKSVPKKWRPPVLFGGLATGARTTRGGRKVPFQRFLKQVHKLGGARFYDALSIHSFDPVPKMKRFIATARKELRRVRRPKRPIWVTEIGVSESAAGSEEAQAQQLVKIVRALRKIPRVEAIFVHRMFDAEHGKSHTDMGLMRTDRATRKIAFCALAAEFGSECPAGPAD